MEKMIKVGIIGTHGTRKTSLCYDFARRLRSRFLERELIERRISFDRYTTTEDVIEKVIELLSRR